jgi:PAS domain S-box-containing protein
VRATLKPVVGLEHTIEHPDGRRMLLSVNATPIPDASGALAGVVCVLTDITKRREEENKTRRSEEKFRALFQKSPLGIAYHRMVYDESGRAVDYEFLDANENYRKLTGVDPRGRKVTEAFPGIKQDPFDWVGTFARCAVKGETIRFQQCLQPNQRWYDCVGFQTTPDHFVASFLEITDLKQAEEELRYHLTLLTSMLYSIPDLIFFKTPEGAYLGCNAEFARHVGRPQEDIVGKTDFDLYEPSEAEAFRANDRQMLEQGTVRRNEEWVGYPDGRRILLETLKAPLITPEGDVIGLIGVSRDITKQRQTASQLRLQSLVLDQIQDRVTVTDLEGVITYVNEAEVRGLGISREAIIGGRTDLYGDDPERGATQRQILEETLQQGEWRGEVVNRTTMGEEVILDCRTQVVLDEQGNRVALAGIATDITERKAMLLALQEHKQLLQGMLEAIPDMVSVHDQDMNILYSNWNGFGGVPEDKRVIGSKCFHTYRGNPDICPDCLAKHALQTNRAIQKELQLPDGRWVDLRIIPMGEGQNKQTLFLEWVRDITESKRSEAERDKLQAQLHQAQKMESVGRLAGGVAHDFNNMLGVILGHIDMALVETDPTSTLHAGLLAVQHAAERSATLTRQLLAFARKQTVSPKVLDLNQTVAGMLQMLHRLIGEDIELQWRPGDSVWPVKIDPSQVDQILANLCVNARDAIADVGKVTIETRNTVLDEAFCAEHEGWVPGDFVLLSLSDNGSGMDSETLSHVFEPFFTTKQQGKGTGLGLATVYGAVKQNKGFISIYSELGLGTTVILYFPRHQGEEERSQQKNDPQPSPRGHEAILLVEDEPAILKMTKMMLERCGYRVLTASTPLEAIRLAGEHGCSLDLLMTDVVMPGMNGRDLANKLLEQYPRMRQLFMSGYTANVIAHHGVLEKGVHFIQKPFSMAELSSKIREVLDLTRDPTA